MKSDLLDDTYSYAREGVALLIKDEWELSKVLDLLVSESFIGNKVQKHLVKILFLIALGLGRRLMEIHSVFKYESLLMLEDLWN